jgi:hypothetical protein
MYAHIYPEIDRCRVASTYYGPDGLVTIPPDTRPVTFPEACPACGAAKSSETGNGGWNAKASYACGGSYSSKPQIQNHTDKWWGSCPITQTANKAGVR